jgi:hypothetical protein
MRDDLAMMTIVRMLSVLVAAGSLGAQPPAAVKEAQGLPPRAAPTDYLVQGKAGAITIAADFTGHGIANGGGALSSEDFVAVDIGLYGPADARLTISASDFSLRINGKKAPLPSQPWGLVAKNIKDPEWVPAEPVDAPKSKGGLSGSGGGGQQPGDPPPLPPKVPIELLRTWQQHLKRAAMPEGDRALPQAGVLFFPYRGKTESIKSVELIYQGPAGKATLTLQ